MKGHRTVIDTDSEALYDHKIAMYIAIGTENLFDNWSHYQHTPEIIEIANNWIVFFYNDLNRHPVQVGG